MCYAIPGKIVEIEDKNAVIDYFGEKKKARNEFLKVEIGDYVYAQGGVLIQKVPKEKAQITLKIWEDKFFDLKKRDIEIAREKEDAESLDAEINKIIQKVDKGGQLNKKESLKLLSIDKENDLEILFRLANRVRQKNINNSSCVHGIIEFSNYCKNDCLYCGIRKSNKSLDRYRMGVDEIVEAARYAVDELGFRALVLQSGEDEWYSTDKIVEIISKIREKCDVLVFVSIGLRNETELEEMYEAGARGILMRFESSSPAIYKSIHCGPKSDMESRIATIKKAKEMGYIVATGFLVGLPGQKEDDLLNDILLTSSLGAEMWSFGPFNPHPQTPLSKIKKCDIKSILKIIAVSRLINLEANILVTTATETLDKENGARLGLLSGANSLMINVTPEKYQGLYLIYPEKSGDNKEVRKNIKEKLALLYSLGRAPTDLGS